MEQKAVVQMLRRYHVQRQAVRTMDTALQVLSPEERLIAEHLLIAPYRGAVEHLCRVLGMESSSVYRHKAKVVEKLEEILL